MTVGGGGNDVIKAHAGRSDIKKVDQQLWFILPFWYKEKPTLSNVKKCQIQNRWKDILIWAHSHTHCHRVSFRFSWLHTVKYKSSTVCGLGKLCFLKSYFNGSITGGLILLFFPADIAMTITEGKLWFWKQRALFWWHYFMMIIQLE